MSVVLSLLLTLRGCARSRTKLQLEVRGDAVPHFDVRRLRGKQFRYSTIWQRRNLVLITLPPVDSESTKNYVSELADNSPEFGGSDAECARDLVPGIPGPGVLVASQA